ncbi:hypothetical protein MMC34_003167 [Xylographa carneopallida]|nr:hypothetical protein [Xylographa carneopallida]
MAPKRASPAQTPSMSSSTGSGYLQTVYREATAPENRSVIRSVAIFGESLGIEQEKGANMWKHAGAQARDDSTVQDATVHTLSSHCMENDALDSTTAAPLS